MAANNNLFEYTDISQIKNYKKNHVLNKYKFLQILSHIENYTNNNEIKSAIDNIINIIKNAKADTLAIFNISSEDETIKISDKVILEILNQIIESNTIERSKYYIKRLKQGLTEIKTNKINDINLNRWKEYEDIFTDSLWILDKRDKSGAHNAGYWGNFIPQIPNQFLRRYTKQGEWVLDPFLGSGTTLIEAKRLGRNGVGIELSPNVVEIAKKNILNEKNPFNIRTEIINADSSDINMEKELKQKDIKSVQFLIMHPPYWDIIKFSENDKDLSNAKTVEEFLNSFGKIIDNTCNFLDINRYFAIVIGDKYHKGEWIPLGFYVMNEVLKKGYLLKSIIVKNFEETKGKINQKELWRYRSLAGGFYVFKHEYIFLFKKGKK